jgi:hypothetical protein
MPRLSGAKPQRDGGIIAPLLYEKQEQQVNNDDDSNFHISRVFYPNKQNC